HGGRRFAARRLVRRSFSRRWLARATLGRFARRLSCCRLARRLLGARLPRRLAGARLPRASAAAGTLGCSLPSTSCAFLPTRSRRHGFCSDSAPVAALDRSNGRVLARITLPLVQACRPTLGVNCFFHYSPDRNRKRQFAVSAKLTVQISTPMSAFP